VTVGLQLLGRFAVLRYGVPASRRLAAAAACVLAACAALVGVAAPTSATSTATFTTWQWNVAGWEMHHGSTTDGMTTAAAASIINRHADVAVLSELCSQQFDDLAARLRAAGWPEDPTNFSRFQSDLADGCGSGHDFGQALFTRAPTGTAQRVELPADTRGEEHWLLCAALGPTTVLACGTHITIDATRLADGHPANVDELNAALRTVEGYEAAGWTVLAGGDFNAQPEYVRLHPWYAAAAGNGGWGHWRELDDTDTSCAGYGDWTATGTPGAAPMCSGGSTTCTASVTTGCAKIDAEFVRENRVAGPYSEAALGLATSCPTIPGTAAYPAGACSDHRVVVGTATVGFG
jgi:hypothetical protein